MICVKSFLVGLAAMLSLILALCASGLRSEERSAGLAAAAGGVLAILGFLAIGFVVFAAARIWMYRSLSRRSPASFG